ncbi:MAG: HAD-IB family phosphatase [Oscillatoria sp. PMC 1068.18]|nr:HAD-IB family phosphatase [Oscillatoria sp. PMC 1076.18]MEC4990728.1 HAD-IB family phosphatase [Oscillatoria sp. PMC 1068.18]
MSSPAANNLPQKAVYCDFDGTITAVETFAGMLKKFAPEMSAKIMPQLYEKKLTLRVGVRQMLEAIPAQQYQAVMNYAQDKPIRAGLTELVDFLDSKNVPFYVVSGGLREMIVRVLSRENEARTPLINRVAGIAAVDVDSSGEYLRVASEFEADSELVAKVRVMEKYPAKEKIAIGDSITDFNMALKADLVFARDRLIKYLEAENKPYLPWNDFFDIRDTLAKQWE